MKVTSHSVVSTETYHIESDAGILKLVDVSDGEWVNETKVFNASGVEITDPSIVKQAIEIVDTYKKS